MSLAGRPVIPAATFLKALHDVAETRQQLFPLRQVTVSGDVDVTMDCLRDGLRIREISFDGRLTFNGCEFGDEVAFIDCNFREGLDLSGSTFSSSLVVLGGSVGVPGVASDDAVLVLDFARFKGDTDIACVSVWGAVVARGCHVEGHLRFSAVRISVVGRLRGPLDLSQTSVNGNVNLNASVSSSIERLRRAPLRDTFGAASGSIGRGDDLTCFSATLDQDPMGLELAGMDVAGAMILMQLECSVSVNCIRSKFSSLDVSLATVAGNIVLSGAKIGIFRAYGLTLTRSLVMIAGSSGQIDVDAFLDERTDFFRPAMVGAIVVSGWTCSEWAKFNVHSVASDAAQPAFNVRGIDIANSTFAGDLLFRNGGALVEYQGIWGPLPSSLYGALNCWVSGLTTSEPIQIKRTSIGGRLDLTSVRTDDVIDLSDTTVSRSIDFHSPLSEVEAQFGSVWRALLLLQYFLRDDDLTDGHRDRMGARARQLRLTRVTAGSIDLTGLTLGGTGEMPEDGSVLASHITVRRGFRVASRAYPRGQEVHAAELRRLLSRPNTLGRMTASPAVEVVERTFHELVKEDLRALGILNYVATNGIDRTRSTAARIPGALKLDNASIGLLTLSSDSFDPDSSLMRQIAKGGAVSVEQQGIVLDNAQIGELCIYRPEPGAGLVGNGFPRPVRLQGVDVAFWRLERGHDDSRLRRLWRRIRSGPEPVTASNDPYESSDSNPYLDVLDNDSEFRASTYLNFEKSLRDRGHDEAGREIFVAGRYRSRRADLPQWHPSRWQPGYGRLRKGPLPFFRLRRPLLEELELFVLLAVLALLVREMWHAREWLAGNGMSPTATSWRAVVFLVAAPIILFILRGSLRRLLDRLYWTFVDYGTSAWRLFIIIGALALASFALFASHSANFEPSPTAAIALKQASNFSVPCGTSPSWGRSEAFWVTLRHHIPLASFQVLDECQPSDGPLHIQYLAEDGKPPAWWTRYIGPWPMAHDWFGLMTLLNYILWPLFIPFLLRRILRQDQRN